MGRREMQMHKAQYSPGDMALRDVVACAQKSSARSSTCCEALYLQ